MEPSDAAAHHRWNHDPDVMRWFAHSYPVSAERFADEYAERPKNSYERVVLGIETVVDGRLIGLVALSGAEPETGGAELDIYIGETDCWGHGYGTEATRLICRYGFAAMRLHRIQLWVADANASAIRVYRKLGFVEEGRARDTLRHDGRWHDMVLMSLLEGELQDEDGMS
ncbi:GNAT family N-acetyltransferase [Jiangella endophytica]|uniref:GNAT family N-acetyltransferase n=1 Tax=Jiangella endophytica TaxID=1623398 RepID=UPI001E576C17|nr:GNAT family protein [Jiangella endophytica]